MGVKYAARCRWFPKLRNISMLSGSYVRLCEELFPGQWFRPTCHESRDHVIVRAYKESKGHFTHETESPSPLCFKHPHWWKRRRSRWSKFATSHYTWGTNRLSDYETDGKSTWIPTWDWSDDVSWSLGLFSKPRVGGRPNIGPGDPGTPDVHNA